MNPSAEDLSARLTVAADAAREAGRGSLQFFQREDLRIDLKDDQSPVTEADRQAEQLLRRRIAESFPADAILGEEFGEQDGTSGFRWILDPIDGTRSFIHGVPLFGTLIGVEYQGDCPIGVIYIPALDEGVYAAVGQGAWYIRGAAAPRPARVSSCPRLADALFLTSQIDLFYPRGAADAFSAFERTCRTTRTWGDCYGYLLVATGRADVMVDPVLKIWDAAALKIVIEEAGGAFTDWNGVPTVYQGEGLACNRGLLPEVLAITRRFAPR